MTDITREAVEARAALLRSDYAADGAAVDADMLLALVNDRDRLATNLGHWRTEIGKLHSKVDRLTTDRDRLAGELAKAMKWAKDAIFSDSEYVKAVDQRADEIAAENATLTADLVAARNAATDAASSLAAAISLLRRGGKKATPSDKMFEQMLLDYEAALNRTRAAFAQANKTEGA